MNHVKPANGALALDVKKIKNISAWANGVDLIKNLRRNKMTETVEKYETNLPEVVQAKSIQLSPIEMAQSFLSSGGDLANLEKMLALQEKFDAIQAKKAFVKAMAKFKTEPIRIVKDKENKQYGSKYSSIGATVNACLPRMGECGLSHKWEFTQKDPKIMTGTCVVTHEEGHSDSVSMDSPIDVSGNKNPIQAIKSTRTYIKIETFSSLMGIASAEVDLDDDGTAAGVQYITEKQVSIIYDMINSTETDETAFLKWIGAESVDAIQMPDFNKCLAALKAKVEK